MPLTPPGAEVEPTALGWLSNSTAMAIMLIIITIIIWLKPATLSCWPKDDEGC
jgi:hypothetical protein